MQRQNWHPADIVAALKKQGTSLAALSRKAGLSSSTLANTLSRPWPKGELIIAQALNIPPDVICDPPRDKKAAIREINDPVRLFIYGKGITDYQS